MSKVELHLHFSDCTVQTNTALWSNLPVVLPVVRSHVFLTPCTYEGVLAIPVLLIDLPLLRLQ